MYGLIDFPDTNLLQSTTVPFSLYIKLPAMEPLHAATTLRDLLGILNNREKSSINKSTIR